MDQFGIDPIRALVHEHPRPTGLAEPWKRLDAPGTRYAVASDVRTEEMDAGGVAAEWTTAPGAQPDRVILFLRCMLTCTASHPC